MPKHKRNSIVNKNIPSDIYLSLYALFQDKNWEIDPKLSCGVFNRYVKTLCELTTEQQKFILELSQRFLHIPIQNYIENIIPILSTIIADYPGKKLYCACCLPEKDIGKTKSSATVLYQLKGTSIKQRVDISNVDIKCIDDIIRNSDILAKPDSILVLVDDFIGTGDTAMAAVEYVKKIVPTIEYERIIIMSIVAMQIGAKVLAEHNIKVYAKHIIQKGITDVYTGEYLENAIKTMREIEKTLTNLDKDFEFGYKQSEALVSMERCPNNTFPIFWLKKNTAPYER